jgi:hypothetical protein
MALRRDAFRRVARGSVRVARDALILAAVAASLAGCASPGGRSPYQTIQHVAGLEERTLEDLVAQRPETEGELADCVGYAVIEKKAVKVPIFAAGGGYGVVYDKERDRRTYIKVRHLGGGWGLGTRNVRVVVLFDDQRALDKFRKGRIEFEVGAEAAAKDDDSGEAIGGSSEEAGRGQRIFVLTDKGLSATATFGVVRYTRWKLESGEIALKDVRWIAQEAYLFAYPMLENYRVMCRATIEGHGSPSGSRFNRFFDEAELLGVSEDRVRAWAWLDVRVEPVVVQGPPVASGRPSSIRLLDLYTHEIEAAESGADGPETGVFLVAGPSWAGEAPDGIREVYRSEGDFVLCLVGEEETRNGNAPYRVSALSDFLGEPPPPEAPDPGFPPYDAAKTASAGFVDYLNFLLAHLDPHPSEARLLEKFAEIGIGPGWDFDEEGLDPAVRKAVDRGVADAHEKIEATIERIAGKNGGWLPGCDLYGDRTALQRKYRIRAAAAKIELYGHPLPGECRAVALVDADGKPLDASRRDYVLRFKARQAPRGDWTLEAHSVPGEGPAGGDAGRRTIGSRTEGLNLEDDGSFTLHVQHEPPGAEREANWLAVPEGRFSLEFRMTSAEAGEQEEEPEPVYVPPPVTKAGRAR